MNLNLVSVDGLRITKARRWVLRCVGCFKLCLVPAFSVCIIVAAMSDSFPLGHHKAVL